jgi:hypothetical protein
MKKALFSEAEVAEAVQEFEVYMAPRLVVAGGRNGDVKVYGENPNARKPPVINVYDENEDINGLLQELGN